MGDSMARDYGQLLGKNLNDPVLVLHLGKTIKSALVNQDMLAWQYNTIGVSDGITMGGEGNTTFVNPALSNMFQE